MVKASFFLGIGGVLIISPLCFSCSTTIVFTPTFFVLFCTSSNFIGAFSFLVSLKFFIFSSIISTLSLDLVDVIDSLVEISSFFNCFSFLLFIFLIKLTVAIMRIRQISIDNRDGNCEKIAPSPNNNFNR
ncbi:MAG: hypothetical protein ACFFAQ_04885 [Promethearchaeota archaeon]